MNFGIALFPTKEVQDFANSYRKRYDPHYNLIQPHLTIRESELWDETRLTEAVLHLEQAARELEPFTIQFNRFSSFAPVSATLYLAMVDPVPILHCNQRICSGILEEPHRALAYTPHLTIGQEMSNDECQDVLASLKKVPVHFQVRFDRFHLMYQTDNQAWTVHQTFLLNKNA